jgi:peptide/nickel transport system permease protein
MGRSVLDVDVTIGITGVEASRGDGSGETDATGASARRSEGGGRRVSTLLAIARRLVRLVVILLLVSFLTFLLMSLLPGDPAVVVAGEGATPEQVAAVRHQLNLDAPLLERYGDWLGDALHGDLGRSLQTNVPVWDSIKERIPVTLELAVGGLLLALVFAIPLGVYAGYRPGSLFDRAVSVLTSGLLSFPVFLVAILLVYLLGVTWHVFPVTGWVPISKSLGDNLNYAFLPILALALTEMVVFTRLLRSDIAATLQEDYILAARARGLPTRTILFGHALRPSAFSLLTVLGVALGRLIGGAVLVEVVFALPGLGQLAITAISQRDYTVVQGVVLFVAVIYVVLNTLVDLAYPLLDPRVRTRTA